MGMNRDVRNAIDGTIRWAVSVAVYEAVYPDLEVDTAGALGEVVAGGMGPTMAVYYYPPHPALADFLSAADLGAP